MDGHEEFTQAREVIADFYEPRPTVKYASVVGLQAGFVGALVSTVQNALGTHNQGAAGFLTRSGGTIGFFGELRSRSFASTRVNNFYNSRNGGNVRSDRIDRSQYPSKG